MRTYLVSEEDGDRNHSDGCVRRNGKLLDDRPEGINKNGCLEGPLRMLTLVFVCPTKSNGEAGVVNSVVLIPFEGEADLPLKTKLRNLTRSFLCSTVKRREQPKVTIHWTIARN
jgi:hypothetical protein